METDTNLQSTEVVKELDLDYDLGNLLAVDRNTLAQSDFRENKEGFLSNLARDNTQLLVNQLFQLEHSCTDGCVVVTLPKTTTRIPREKRIPKAKPLTKWEQYAKDKGIKKRKKTKLVWDEMVKDWVPRYGYKKVQAEHAKDWLLEVPDTADPYEDQFTKKKLEAGKDRKERTAETEEHRTGK